MGQERDDVFGEAEHYLFEIMGVEGLNIGPATDDSPWARDMEAGLVRDGYLFINETKAFRLTEKGKSVAIAWKAANFDSNCR
jgi:hypothetical protein